METFPGSVGLQQRVLPAYRKPFLEKLALACEGGLSVFAGQPLPVENVLPAGELIGVSFTPADNRHYFPFNSPFYQCYQSGWQLWLESRQPDILIVEANARYPSTRQMARWMHARQKPVIGWGLGAPGLRGRGEGFLRRWREQRRNSLLRSLDGLIAYSQRGAEEYRLLGFPAERVFVAPNAAAARPAHPLPHRKPGYQGRPVVLFVGRLQARKRIDLLLRACAGLPESIQPRVWIIGDGPARLVVQKLAQEVYPQAEFLGALHGDALHPYLSQADLFVLPGTGGLAVQQAMAYGLPVVVAQGDGTQGDMVRPENGWLIPPGDQQALQQALSTALQDVGRLRKMGAESYRIVAEEINLESMVVSFIKALNRVAESFPHTRRQFST